MAFSCKEKRYTGSLLLPQKHLLWGHRANNGALPHGWSQKSAFSTAHRQHLLLDGLNPPPRCSMNPITHRALSREGHHQTRTGESPPKTHCRAKAGSVGSPHQHQAPHHTSQPLHPAIPPATSTAGNPLLDLIPRDSLARSLQ